MNASYIIRLSWPAWKTWTKAQLKSVVRVVRRQGSHRLKNIYETKEYIALCFDSIFIGVEKNADGSRNIEDGYAHS